MAKPPEDPAGPVRTICISLSPTRLDKLDALVTERDSNRSAVLGKLLDRVTIRDGDPTPLADIKIPTGPAVYPETVNGCAHTRFDVITGGLKRCRDCEGFTDMKGTWHTP